MLWLFNTLPLEGNRKKIDFSDVQTDSCFHYSYRYYSLCETAGYDENINWHGARMNIRRGS